MTVETSESIQWTTVFEDGWNKLEYFRELQEMQKESFNTDYYMKYLAVLIRSEERRVGKECIYRW